MAPDPLSPDVGRGDRARSFSLSEEREYSAGPTDVPPHVTMMAQPAGHGPAPALARFVRTEGLAILAGWRQRLRAVPAGAAPSLSPRGAQVLAWLADSLDAPDDAPREAELPGSESLSGPRAIAELALLAETIDQLCPAPAAEAPREALYRVIDAAIAHSQRLDGDEADRARKRLRLATEVTRVGSWELDPARGVVTADARTRELFGLPDGQPATLDALTSRLHADDRDRVRDGVVKMLGAGRPYLDDCRVMRAHDGGFRWVAVAVDAHQGALAAAPRVLGIVHDITDRKRSEEEHARLVEEMSRAVHNSEMFVGILSHDLRNPLSSILAGAQLLGRELPGEKSSRVLGRVVASGERMVRMIDQLLDFTRARLGEGIQIEREAVDLARLAQETLDEGRAAHPAAAVTLSVSGDTVGDWDRDRVSQVLSNLVGNALQHGAASGVIEVALDGTDPARVTLSVRNQGAIPQDLRSVVFSPFRGTLQKRGNPSQSKGLGLGMYIARQIALAHGGELGVESTDAATAFTLSLPRHAEGTEHAVRQREDFAREEELAAFEHLASRPRHSLVTAHLFGATPLHERAPLEHADIVDRYAALLDTALNRKAYRGQGEGLSDDLRALAERLGDLGASPREVTDVHARALRSAVRGVSAAKAQALLAEGRLLALELMGNLASYYRRRSRGQVGTGT